MPPPAPTVARRTEARPHPSDVQIALDDLIGQMVTWARAEGIDLLELEESLVAALTEDEAPGSGPSDDELLSRSVACQEFRPQAPQNGPQHMAGAFIQVHVVPVVPAASSVSESRRASRLPRVRQRAREHRSTRSASRRTATATSSSSSGDPDEPGEGPSPAAPCACDRPIPERWPIYDGHGGTMLVCVRCGRAVAA